MQNDSFEWYVAWYRAPDPIVVRTSHFFCCAFSIFWRVESIIAGRGMAPFWTLKRMGIWAISPILQIGGTEKHLTGMDAAACTCKSRSPQTLLCDWKKNPWVPFEIWLLAKKRVNSCWSSAAFHGNVESARSAIAEKPHLVFSKDTKRRYWTMRQNIVVH